MSAWAFGGAQRGEISELFDDENGYWMARLDSVVHGGEASLDRVSGEVRQRVATEKALDRVMPTAEQFARTAATTSLETAARDAGVVAVLSKPFTNDVFARTVDTALERRHA